MQSFTRATELTNMSPKNQPGSTYVTQTFGIYTYKKDIHRERTFKYRNVSECEIFTQQTRRSKTS